MQEPFLMVLRMLKQLFCSNYQWISEADNVNLLYNKNIDFNVRLTLK